MFRFCVAALALGAAALLPASDPMSPAPGGAWSVEESQVAGYPFDVPYGGHPPGGYERRIGKPYYWSVPGGTVPLASVGGAPEAHSGQAVEYGGNAGAGGSCGCSKGDASASHTGPAAYGGPAGFGVPETASRPTAGPAGDPYSHHFGPGFYRSDEFGHYRFPYYSYRRPWYDVGHPVRVRDTNLPW